MILCPQCPKFYDRNEIALYDRENRRLEVSRWAIPSEEAVERLPSFVKNRIANIRIREARERLERGASWRCPRGHSLPDDFVSTPMVIIGLIGPPYTMKTTYLGQLVAHLVEREALGELGLSFSFADNASREAYAAKMAARLERGRPPEATLMSARDGEVTEPIILRMSSGPAHSRQKVNLLFFDAAGEGTLNAQKMARDNTFLHVINAALLFVTPRALTLPGDVPEPVGYENRGTRQAIAAFDHLAWALQQHPRYAGKHAPRDLPIALVLAKADQLAPVLKGATVPGLPLDETFLVDTDDKLDAVGELPYDILMRYGGQSLASRLFELTEQRSIHAVSAMGGDPEFVPSALGSSGLGASGGYAEQVFRTVQPWHVVDPLLALLYQLGYVGSSGADD